MTHNLKQLQVRGTYFEVGQAIGQHCAEQIHASLDSYPFFQQELIPYHRSEAGQLRYEQFLELNQAQYPEYIAELEGLANGAQRPFEELFLLNLRGEYRDFFHQFQSHGCADCAVVTDELAMIGHNEDAAPEFAGQMYLVQADIPDKPEFTALTYPGFLCGNAFGFNDRGICFAVDNVRPLSSEPGLARHFVARSLLEAETLDDAIIRVTIADQASGFHYTIGSVTRRRVISVETSPTKYSISEIEDGFFHANHYCSLEKIEQVVDESSEARLSRGLELIENNLPTIQAELLAILGDQSHPTHPIYGSETTLNPLLTHFIVLFDLDQSQALIYNGHPSDDATECIEFSI